MVRVRGMGGADVCLSQITDSDRGEKERETDSIWDDWPGGTSCRDISAPSSRGPRSCCWAAGGWWAAAPRGRRPGGRARWRTEAGHSHRVPHRSQAASSAGTNWLWGYDYTLLLVSPPCSTSRGTGCTSWPEPGHVGKLGRQSRPPLPSQPQLRSAGQTSEMEGVISQYYISSNM